MECQNKPPILHGIFGDEVVLQHQSLIGSVRGGGVEGKLYSIYNY